MPRKCRVPSTRASATWTLGGLKKRAGPRAELDAAPPGCSAGRTIVVFAVAEDDESALALGCDCCTTSQEDRMGRGKAAATAPPPKYACERSLRSSRKASRLTNNAPNPVGTPNIL
eukprot:scaffold198868_cov32-Tisochrysis_lutea.AAC.3